MPNSSYSKIKNRIEQTTFTNTFKQNEKVRMLSFYPSSRYSCVLLFHTEIEETIDLDYCGRGDGGMIHYRGASPSPPLFHASAFIKLTELWRL